jgi:hypothetical protein
VAEKLGIDLIWLGVLYGVNMQTSFMHPPFGFALFYLRSVAPAKDYTDKLTGRLTARVTTGQIYWGAVPFVLIQIIMVSLIIAFPGIVTGGIAKKQAVDVNKIQIEVPIEEPAAEPSVSGQSSEQEEAEKALERELGGPAKSK